MTVRSDRFAIAPRGAHKKPLPRLVVYGEPGVGKTTFGASAPDAILVPTEDGALGVDVARVPAEGKCETWADLLAAARVAAEADGFSWLVVDTLNAAEHLCAQHVCDRDFGGRWNTAKGQEGYSSYGKGDKATAEEFRALLAILDAAQQKHGKGVVLLSHAGLMKSGNALGADYQKFAGDMGKNVWSLVCGWADQVAHACREIRVSARDGEKAKAQAIGSERWLVFEGGPGRDAKSRAGYEMPEKVLLSWEDYAGALESDRCAALIAQAVELIGNAVPEARAEVEKRLGGKATADALAKVPKQRIEALIGWLMAKQTNNGKEAA